MVASIVYAASGEPITWWPLSVAWMALLLLLGFLMVSTWRYYSFKGINLSKGYPWLIVILLAAVVYGIVHWAKILFLVMALQLHGRVVLRSAWAASCAGTGVIGEHKA